MRPAFKENLLPAYELNLRNIMGFGEFRTPLSPENFLISQKNNERSSNENGESLR